MFVPRYLMKRFPSKLDRDLKLIFARSEVIGAVIDKGLLDIPSTNDELAKLILCSNLGALFVAVPFASFLLAAIIYFKILEA